VTEEVTDPLAVVSPPEPPDGCEHERCAVASMTLNVDFRRDGKTEDTQTLVLAHEHGTHPAETFLNLLGAMQRALFEQAEWVMETFDLPPEIVALAVKGEIEIHVEKRKRHAREDEDA
jgi:hypothetical protein